MTRWTGRCASRGLALLSLGIVLVIGGVGGALLLATRGTGAPAWIGWLLVVVAVVVGVAGYLLSSLVMRVEDDRVVVAYGPFGWPRRTLALADIREVSAGQIDPMEWGGWGYRWIPWARASAAVIRRGPGIVLGLEGGRRFAVTVDESRAGAVAIGEALEAARRR
ncbi:hypothetical protein [Longivirga aurantiaca]|uniref:Bacterial Pleckstrin homology domain-containing protein n=1 Tax=Longivirga aurantiaca TaxID=1837743 RepID=A0ABW1T5I7_9ACTN